MFKNIRNTTYLQCPPPVRPIQIPPWIDSHPQEADTSGSTTPRIVEEYLRLRSLPAQDELGNDAHRIQQALRAAERDHDWTAKKAMTMLQYAPSDPSISYNIVSILRVIERRARRARLVILSNANYADDNQREFWKATICQDLDDEQDISEGALHWDSETEDRIGRERLRLATQKQLGMSSRRLERWLRNTEREAKA